MSKVIELLEKIVTNTNSSMDPLWVAGITGATAVLTALATSVIAYKMNKNTLTLEREKIKAEIITKERMLWLKQLRENASDLFSDMDLFYSLLKSDRSSPTVEKQKELSKLSKPILTKSNALMFCLIKKDDAQLALYNSINEIQKFMVEYPKTRSSVESANPDEEYIALKESFTTAMENIGSETWRQIKGLE
ncbi:MAG: hypothetical protein ACI9W6_002784 [Motiliproteus sp.]